MVNRYKRTEKRKKGRKKWIKSFANLSRPSWGCVFVVKGWLGVVVKWKGRSVG